MRSEWEFSDLAALGWSPRRDPKLPRPAWFLAEPDRQLPRERRTFLHRDFEDSGDDRNKRALADNRHQDNNEDDSIDAVGASDSPKHRKRRQEDRHRAFEARPGDEGQFVPAKTRPGERRANDER